MPPSASDTTNAIETLTDSDQCRERHNHYRRRTKIDDETPAGKGLIRRRHEKRERNAVVVE